MTYPLNVRFTIDDEWIETLIEMAGYGIAYWAKAATWDEARKTYRVTDTTTSKVLTYGGMARAVQKILSGDTCLNDDARAAVFDALLDPGDVDADVADHVIQVACFGDYTYA